MRYQTTILCVLSVVISTLTSAAVATEAPQASQQAGNAALTYWKAFAMLPQLDEDDHTLLESSTKTPVNERVRAIVGKAGLALNLMHQGASIESCDWGHDMSQGFELLLPHCGKARELARLSVLRARVRLADGDGKGAGEDFAATLRFAHHLGAGGETLIEMLVDYSMRDLVIKAAGSHLVSMTPPQREQLAAVVKEIQPATQNAEMARRERKSIPYIERVLRERGLSGFVERLQGEVPEDHRQLIGALHEQLSDPQNLAIVVNRLDAEYDRLVDDASLPYAEAMGKIEAHSEEITQRQSKLNDWKKSPKLSEDPEVNLSLVADALLNMILPSLGPAKSLEASTTIHHAMLRAAIAYANGGAAAAAKITDPITGEAFKITADEGQPGWIELAGTVTRNGKPVTLRAKIR